MSTPRPPIVDVHLVDGELQSALERDVRVGLTAKEKWLPPVWFYDDRGSELFDEITRLPEYYPTRAEHLLLETRAPDIVNRAKADTLVELGAGTCAKTRTLLDAMRSSGILERYVPLDVSAATLREAAEGLAADYPELTVHAVVGDFHHHLELLPTGGRRMVAFLGGTIGNLTPPERAGFLFDLDCLLVAGDTFLLGTDLVKDPARLIAAYDDAEGVTAAFNRNLLRVLNRALGANFVVEQFDHVALWNQDAAWMEMRLRSRVDQRVVFPGLGLEVTFAAGEDLRTEISAKFTPEGLEKELLAAGFVVEAMWDQPGGDFLLTLARPYC
jgi:L-histidine N-alpha-methyltransferase